MYFYNYDYAEEMTRNNSSCFIEVGSIVNYLHSASLLPHNHRFFCEKAGHGRK